MAKLAQKSPLIPTLFISNYYDDLINEIDIYTETLIETIKNKPNNSSNESLTHQELPPRNHLTLIPLTGQHNDEQQVVEQQEESIFCKSLKDPYSDEYTFDETLDGNEITLDRTLTTSEDFVHSTRMQLIEYILGLKEKNIRWYEECPDKSRFKVEPLASGESRDKVVEDFKRRILNPKFCFCIELKESAEKLFKMCLVELDFYLSCDEIDFFK